MTNNVSAKECVLACGMHWHQQADKAQLAQALSDAITEQLLSSISANDSASLVVSGGSTPAPVFAKLASADIPWSKVQVTLADERWVAPGHADSNESLVRDTLLVDKASSATFVSLFRSDVKPEQAVADVAADLRKMRLPFSAVILGMGGDGHTASLFPDANADELSSAMALDNTDDVAILHPPSVSQVRITLTRAALLNADHRYLHITGNDKETVLADALVEATNGAWQLGMKPVVGLLTESPSSVSVFWSP